MVNRMFAMVHESDFHQSHASDKIRCLPTIYNHCHSMAKSVDVVVVVEKNEHQITVCDGWRTKLNAGIRTLSTNSFQCYRLPALIEPTQHSFHICFSISNSHSPSHPARHSTQKQQQFKQKPTEYFFPIFHTYLLYTHIRIDCYLLFGLTVQFMRGSKTNEELGKVFALPLSWNHVSLGFLTILSSSFLIIHTGFFF